jgi:hypothetical protein
VHTNPCKSKNCSGQGTCNSCTLMADLSARGDHYSLQDMHKIASEISTLENLIEDLPYTEISIDENLIEDYAYPEISNTWSTYDY